MTWIPQATDDGSFTFFSAEFGETFHSRQGAKTEAFQKFAQVTELAAKSQGGTLKLLDICYGLGYNTAAALEVIWAANPDCQVELIGLELDVTVPQAAIAPPLIASWTAPIQQILQALALTQSCTTQKLQAQLFIGDARQTLRSLQDQGWLADAIFFDPFSPRCCPQLWTVDFFALVVHYLAKDGKLATYSRSAAVRAAMIAAGLAIGTIPPGASHLPHEWSQGTVGALCAEGLYPLSQLEQEHLQTRAAIPYRDLTLRDTAAAIHSRHQQEQQTCGLESTTSWRRRWKIE
jgi:tRNA U34 5-methylaminomethyl-2-thiouridine-forming methyltransferase MnmC